MGNDITIIMGIVAFFLLIGFVSPYINKEFSSYGADIPVRDSTIIPKDQDLNISGVTDEDDVKARDILVSLLTIWVWTYDVPLWLNLLLMIPRLALVITIGRNLWIGGGG